jgi:non-specific serine/threonine protein kinase
MLEMLQQYALERLAERGEAEEVRGEHTAWFLALAERAEGELRGPREAEWTGRLESEAENLRAAMRRLIDGGAAEQALRMTSALWRFWSQRGHLIEGLDWLRQALALTDASGGANGALRRARAGALNGAGNLAGARGEHARSVPFHEESLAIRRELGDRAGEAISLLNLGTAARNLGDRALAHERFDESLGLFRSLGDTRNSALTLLNLGRLAHDEGDHERATTHYQEGLALFQTVGSDHGVATALNRMGDLARVRGDLATAERLHSEALSLREGRGDPWVIGLSLIGLARVAAARRDHARTMTFARQSLRSLHEAGATRDAANALVVMAAAACATGQAATGAQLLGAVDRAYPHGSAVPAEQVPFEEAVAAARAALGQDGYAAASGNGERLTFDQAVDVALTMAEPALPAASVPTVQLAGPSIEALTAREREVAAWIARGLTNREIAEKLIISEWTADSHVRHILTKLGFRSRAQVAAWAIERGLTPPDTG